INVPWQDYIVLGDVALVALDPQVTPVDLTASIPMQVARGSVVTDTDGTRQATLLVPQGTQAQLTFANGTTQALTSLHVRATEYTVGPNPPAATPARLPPATPYPHAV